MSENRNGIKCLVDEYDKTAVQYDVGSFYGYFSGRNAQ